MSQSHPRQDSSHWPGDGLHDELSAQTPVTPVTPITPYNTRRLRSTRTSEVDLRSRLPPHITVDETSSLLGHRDGTSRSYKSMPSTPGRPTMSRHQSSTGGSIRVPRTRHHNRSASFGTRLATALVGAERQRDYDSNLEDSKGTLHHDDRVWYDQFTSTDWVHDSIADAYRVKALRARKDIRGRIIALLDGAEGWVLVAIIGCITAMLAYWVDVTEKVIFDLKEGYCSQGWYLSKKVCCFGEDTCEDWTYWSEALSNSRVDDEWVDFAAYVIGVMVFSVLACCLTLTTKTVVPSAVRLSTLDENLAAERQSPTPLSANAEPEREESPRRRITEIQQSPAMVFYSAAGSGVAEVKVILSGFVLHGYLGAKTLVVKVLGLVLSVGSGLSLGKEGPYVHMAACVGNIACRIFKKYNHNDAKRREVLSASAASGVAVAFGTPIGGVLFSLEEVSYYFPPKTLFRTFFCCIVAALSLKFLNPYGTNKIVMFEVRYTGDWRYFEMIIFILLGFLGGAAGALFIKATGLWARTFRRISIIKRWPVLEVVLVALVTGFASFWNRYTKLAVADLLYELASPCGVGEVESSLCPQKDDIPSVVLYLTLAFIIKAVLTTITFGIKVPAGIYVPSMVVGGLLGRIVGHIVQYILLTNPNLALSAGCPVDSGPESCVTPGIYALVAAGATMCGVTRLSVTLAVILFELTGSLDHVLPFSIAVLVAKWTADAIEPLSIYDLLTAMNSYPFLDNKVRPVFTSELADITPRPRESRIIDISGSPLVAAYALRRKLEDLHAAGELDGGLPILRHGVLVGLIPAPDLEYALDSLDDDDQSLCLMAADVKWGGGGDGEEDEDDEDPTDFTPYIDPAPVALDVHSPLDLVYEVFVKLGLRYVCVLRDGRYAGLVHKKTFVKYCREIEGEGRGGG